MGHSIVEDITNELKTIWKLIEIMGVKMEFHCAG